MRTIIALSLLMALAVSSLAGCAGDDLSVTVKAALEKMEVTTYRCVEDQTLSGNSDTYLLTMETDFAGPDRWRTRMVHPEHWKEVTVIEDRQYIRSDVSPEWQAIVPGDDPVSISELVYSAPWTSLLSAAYLQATSFKSAGTEGIEGASCRVYTGNVDVNQIRKQNSEDWKDVSSVSHRVWIDLDGYVRQIETEVEYNRDVEIYSGIYTSMHSTTSIYDLNAVITIEEPDVA